MSPAALGHPTLQEDVLWREVEGFSGAWLRAAAVGCGTRTRTITRTGTRGVQPL